MLTTCEILPARRCLLTAVPIVPDPPRAEEGSKIVSYHGGLQQAAASWRRGLACQELRPDASRGLPQQTIVQAEGEKR